MMADRKNHIDNIVEPSLEKGIWVISDRYLDSSYAYQGGGRQIEVSKIDLLTELLKLPIPDLTLLFDLSPEIALQRAKNRSELDRFESEPIDFHQRIREAYLTLANDNIQRYNVIDASKDIQNVKDQVQKKLNQFIN
jgi:dTMP kinase